MDTSAIELACSPCLTASACRATPAQVMTDIGSYGVLVRSIDCTSRPLDMHSLTQTTQTIPLADTAAHDGPGTQPCSRACLFHLCFVCLPSISRRPARNSHFLKLLFGDAFAHRYTAHHFSGDRSPGVIAPSHDDLVCISLVVCARA